MTSRHDVHLVGSIPLASVDEVFAKVGTILGSRAPRIPDGEVARPWLGWLETVFSAHPDFVPAEQHHRAQGGDALQRYRLRDGVHPQDVRFVGLRHAAVAEASYAAFVKAKSAGTVPEDTRFLYAIATPVAVIDRYVTPDQQRLVEPAYEAALLQEVARITQRIPHESLAIQWDVAREVISAEAGTPTPWGSSRAEIQAAHCERLCRLGRAVPEDVDLLYHLCYGDFAHRHAIEPPHTGLMVDYANRLSAALDRDIALFHMPVPRDRDDDAYFAPLDRLALRSGTRICLGLVHLTDGIEGAQRRMAAADRHLREYAIATECGFGRRPPEVVTGLLRLHAQIADMDGRN